jgi:hypothetical protein
MVAAIAKLPVFAADGRRNSGPNDDRPVVAHHHGVA